MDRSAPGPGARSPARPAPPRGEVLRAVDDLQGAAADLGWAEATGLADGLVDALSHLLVDLADGSSSPTPQPLVVGAIGGPARPVDHASCRAAAAALRRVAPVLDAGPPWGAEAARVALELADLFDRVADDGRSGRVPPGHKGVVLRRLHGLQRRLQALG
ncbi:hypothetical protein [Ornithinimicrobium pekingense]|uniref:DUF222 domain-containing protein n=1 Tax=Ornithinimicrobium pekingense TaxID=384677 RepID=A0ABQ2FA03_9MICO|nr:hypothetical protein [Ornithinimicrobium pekingense]GGK67316.1 hypothetical protein GCM10011509_14580 [Ornithinimicrobium pekingense]